MCHLLIQSGHYLDTKTILRKVSKMVVSISSFDIM